MAVPHFIYQLTNVWVVSMFGFYKKYYYVCVDIG